MSNDTLCTPSRHPVHILETDTGNRDRDRDRNENPNGKGDTQGEGGFGVVATLRRRAQPSAPSHVRNGVETRKAAP
jgi:hypothetical protein